jgi:hypothetical protein
MTRLPLICADKNPAHREARRRGEITGRERQDTRYSRNEFQSRRESERCCLTSNFK